ncbi:hypothetical protein D0A34_15885 [Microcoleus vaginatus PCC 9802]|uniref:hypothetical protein n=1 Tax=Microcoleus vaginatus TaxID=119532 RepID=UPI00020D138C|nr:hypothetical protein MicvaDRAFT_3769 [Microcoleus vaginatus FGP-2]UNU20162.1 hypothetical protein D0A34_15885 [Microcoleus vaginatus PCC 9802]
MKKLNRRPQNKTTSAKKVNQVKKSDNSNIKWSIKEVVVPIAIALIPLATTYISTQNTQQPPNPPIEHTTPQSQ